MGVHLICHLCGQRISPARDLWEADHIRRHAEGGEESVENLWPAHEACHKAKSRKDTTDIAKGKRVAAKHYGIKRTARPIAGSRSTKWKKKMNGQVVPR
jgi:5-methylcytosine-specific restriction endonuclease McrA